MTWRGTGPTESEEHADVGVRGEENKTLVGGHRERAGRLDHACQPNLPPLSAEHIQGAQASRPRPASDRAVFGVDDPRPPVAALPEGVFERRFHLRVFLR